MRKLLAMKQRYTKDHKNSFDHNTAGMWTTPICTTFAKKPRKTRRLAIRRERDASIEQPQQ
jgi:hypothetical protein